MKFELSWKLALIAAGIGIVGLTLQRSGWLGYAVERGSYGASVSVAAGCYAIPSGWTVLPAVATASSVDLRRHFSRHEHAFASLVDGGDIRARVLLAPLVGQREANGYGIHDIGSLTGGTMARFAAVKDDSTLIVLGQNEEDVRDLVQRLTGC